MIRWALLFVFSGIAGALLDGIHTHSGMTEYTTPWVWMMAAWTPVLFGFAGVAIALSHVLSDRVSARRSPVPSWPATVAGVLVFAAAYGASGYLPAGNGVKTIVLLAIFIGVFVVYDRTPQGIVLAAIAALCGVAAEYTLTEVHAFRHLYPDVAHVPYWLPALYMVASVTVGNIGRRIASNAKQRRILS